MWIRSMMLMLAVGCVGTGDVAEDQTGSVSENSVVGEPFQCVNKASIQVVSCVGKIATLPINIDVKDVRVLNDNELTILSDDLNHLSILDGNILDHNKILNDVELNVLSDFLNKFLVNVSKNDINVCTALLGIPLCK